MIVEKSMPGTGRSGQSLAESNGPALDETQWGYVIRDTRRRSKSAALGAMGGPLLGIALLVAAIGVWSFPGRVFGPGLVALRLAVMVIFGVLGSYLVWAGSSLPGAEVHVDLSRGEFRVGARGLGGKFRLRAVVTFAQVSSVFLHRSKDQRQPARLLLRVGNGNRTVQVAVGGRRPLEALRDRLVSDMHRLC